MVTWPESLVDDLVRQKVVILIGSGVSANSVAEDGDRPPTWGVLLRDAHDELPKKLTHITAALKRYSYLEAAEYLKIAMGDDAWKRFIKKKFVDKKYLAADIHKHIFSLDQRIVISLNFDRIYEDYANKFSDDAVTVKNYYDDDIRSAVCGNDRYVLKPHGSVESMSKVIFTLIDYGKARNNHRNFYEVMTSLLHTHTFLCIGCGVSDPDIQMLFEDYRFKYSESPHYMLQPSPLHPAQVKVMADSRGINLIKYSGKNGHQELTTSLAQLSKMVYDLKGIENLTD